jgi:hypothetical protein
MLANKLRPPECLSDLVLDQWRAGEIEDGARLGELEAHVAGCERCRSRRAAFDRRRRATFRASLFFRLMTERACRRERSARRAGCRSSRAPRRWQRRRCWPSCSELRRMVFAAPTKAGRASRAARAWRSS